MSSIVNEYSICSDKKEGDHKIFLNEDFVLRPEFKDTLRQIKQIVKHPSISHARIMPDCHYGSGCCVGLTSHLTEKILPRLIGGDIGCGILTYNLHKYEKSINLEKIDRDIRSVIPLGNANYKHYVTDRDIEDLCAASDLEADHFIDSYEDKFGIDISQFKPDYSPDWLKKKCKQIKINYDMVLKSLCTLGGGNHYIELDKDEKDIYLTIHSGSRAFGGKICRYHQDKIDKNCKLDWVKYNHKLRQINKTYKNRPEEKLQLTEKLIEEFTTYDHPDYLEGEESYEYFFDMIFCQKFAQLNRFLMLRRIIEGKMAIEYDPEDMIESIHNYIDFRDLVIRKGAISCHQDQLCIVSWNMSEGISICEGKTNNQDWNMSAPHGAGRDFSRADAEKRFTLKEFQESMKDVYSTSICKDTIDESPMAYRDPEIIINSIQSSITIKKHLKSILNIKALE